MFKEQLSLPLENSKCVVVLSGGQDSTTCLFYAKQLGHEIHTISFDYGQRHAIELKCAAKVSELAGAVTHKIVDIRQVLQGTSPLVSDAPLEQYEDHRSLPGGLEKTFVPMRNQLFLTIAANRAYILGAHHLVTGVSAEDFGGYPDCRRTFIDAMEEASRLGTFTGEEDTLPPLEIHTPLMLLTKEETVRLALTLDGCYEALAYTHTAYDGLYPPTGKDHASLLRAKGFEEAGVPDPLVIRAVATGVMEKYPPTSNYDASNPKLVDYFVRTISAIGGAYVHG